MELGGDRARRITTDASILTPNSVGSGSGRACVHVCEKERKTVSPSLSSSP